MANQPNINRSALVAVKRASAGSLPIGRGGVFTGSYSADGFALVDASSGADGTVHCVVVESTPSDADVGYVVIAGLSLVQLQIGSVGGNGGSGGLYGGGGGGGGGSAAGSNSGSGGTGGNGVVIVITY